MKLACYEQTYVTCVMEMLQTFCCVVGKYNSLFCSLCSQEHCTGWREGMSVKEYITNSGTNYVLFYFSDSN